MEYCDHFEMLIEPLKRSERVMLDSIFISGLKDEIQADLKLYEARTLSELMDKALLLEEKNAALMKGGLSSRERGDWRDRNYQSRTRPIGDWNRAKNLGSKQIGGAGGTIETKGGEEQKGGKSFEGGRRLSQAELEERSKKGLCFKCGEKWGRDHICKFKHLQLVLCEGNEEEEDNEGDSEAERAGVGGQNLETILEE